MESELESAVNIVIKPELLKLEPPEDDDDYIETEEVNSPLLTGIVISDSLQTSETDTYLGQSSSTNVFRLGQTFKSFSEVATAIQVYESENKVNLNQKYFRRIAANPKPSNKEDYSLTVEERKSFVYRWVDFCCTYFDSLPAQSRSDLDGTLPPLGFTMKECPMRIRFQTRFKEKDLIVSILRESHDHSHPGSIPNRNSSNTIPEKSDLVPSHPTKQNLRPPPSLAPLPTNPLSRAKSLSAPSPLSARRNTAGHMTPLLKIPRPPPLKKGPLPTGLLLQGFGNGGRDPLRKPFADTIDTNPDSSKAIIRNIFNFLSRMKSNRPGCKNPIAFTSSNPDIIKLTADIAGVDQKAVREILVSRPRPTQPRSNPNELSNQSVVLTNKRYAHQPMESRRSDTLNRSNKRPITQPLQRDTFQKRSHFANSTNDSVGNWTSQISLNAESSAAYQKLANLPLDISIKPEMNSCTSEEEEYSIEYDEREDYNNFFKQNSGSDR